MERKMRTKNKTKNITVFLILSLTLLTGGNLQVASAQNLDELSNYFVHLAITPENIEDGSQSHPIGYVYVVNKNGVSITSSTDVEVKLTSDNPIIAQVPESITFPANAEYVQFDIVAGQPGTTAITASINGKQGFADITVGTQEFFLPDNLNLVLNFPTNKMHVNSEMPFTVFMQTEEGTIVRAPFDVDVKISFEESLAVPNDDVLTIKEGEYYAWGTISTGERVGNAFIRAIQEDAQLDTAQSIEITSTLPAALNINVYPYLIPAEINRNIDVFVSVVDSNGDPTVANEDIPLKFFSNNQDFIGDELDDFMEENKMVIKKGQFGYNFRLKMDLIGLVSNDLMIGVSSAGYGTAIDKFQTVGESISVEDKRITDQSLITSDKVLSPTDKKAVQLFGPLKIPSNATAVFAYQIAVVEDDDGDNSENDPNFEEIDIEDFIARQEEDEETRREGQNAQDIGGTGDVEDNTSSSSSSSSSEDEDDDVIIYTIDNLKEGNLYPLQANEDYRSTGLIRYLDVISEDKTLATVVDPGNIKPSYSYGITKVKTEQKSGEFLISANIKGIGSGSFRTEVVNTLEQKNIKAFSPTGKDSILVNQDGSFELFLVALDGAQRPKVLEFDKRYLITPSNGIVDIKRGQTFTLTSLQSESFKLVEGGDMVLNVESIGQSADVTLKSTSTFDTQLSSKLNVLFPIEKLDVNDKNHFGVVQITDLHGNPIKSIKDLKTKITSSNEGIVETNQDAVIKKGSSYAQFPMETTEKLGKSLISAITRGVVKGNSTINVATSSSGLSVYTSGLIEPIPMNKPIEVTIFVDDDLGDSIAGSTVVVTSKSGNNATINSLQSDTVRTGPDGSATFELFASGGPEIDIQFSSSAAGFKDSVDTKNIVVDYDPSMSVAELALPQELVYVIIGGIAVVAVVIGLFLKKSKETIEDEEEPWEDEDI
jgi:hypothetical protein